MREQLRDVPQGEAQVAEHQLRRKTEHREPGRLKYLVPALVSTAPARVVRAVYLHDQPRRRSEEIDDEAADDDLPTKLRPELIAAERPPKDTLRLGRSHPHTMRVRVELLLPLKFAVCA
jgi:hypothetical protein